MPDLPSPTTAAPEARAEPQPPSPGAVQVRHPRLLLWLVATGMFMQLLDATIVNTALPTMALSLGESPLRMQAVVVAYALTMAVVIPATGWLAERFGTQRVFSLAIALFTLASVACAASTSLGQLTAARVLQGVGGAMLMPVGRLVVLKAFPGEQFLRAISFVAMPALIGPLLGPTLGGWLVEVASWHWIFLINVPVGVLGLFAVRRYMPNFTSATPGRFDLGGYALLGLAMVSISLALDGLSGLGWSHAVIVFLVVLGLAALSAYWLHALRHPSPLFAPVLFALHSYRVGLLGNLFARIGSGAMPYLIPLFMQVALGCSPVQSGLLMLPVALAGIGVKRLTTATIRYLGYRRVLVTNTVLMGGVIASFALMGPQQALGWRIAQLALFGAVNSFQFTAMNAVTLKDLGSQHAASGNSLFSMVQMLGMSLGVSCAAGLLAAFGSWMGQGDASSTLAAFRATLVVIGGMTALAAVIFGQLTPLGGDDLSA